MGEYAEMMLDGTLCEGCGEYIGLDTGFPGYCSPECAADRGASEVYSASDPKPHSCPVCNKRFSTVEAVNQHHKVKHIEQAKVSCPDCGKAVSRVGLDGHRGSPNCQRRAARVTRRHRAEDAFDLIDEEDKF